MWNPVYGDPDAPTVQVVVRDNRHSHFVDQAQLVATAYLAGAVVDTRNTLAAAEARRQRDRAEDHLVEDLRWHHPDLPPGLLRSMARERLADLDRQALQA